MLLLLFSQQSHTRQPQNVCRPQPKSQLDLVATFAPLSDKAINYNIQCRVRSKPTPLTINVKGEGYALKHGLMAELAGGRLVELAPRADNPVDLGQVGLGAASCDLISLR